MVGGAGEDYYYFKGVLGEEGGEVVDVAIFSASFSKGA